MRIAHLWDTRGVDGAVSNADRLCRAFDDRDEIDLTAMHINGTGFPENFWSAKPKYLVQFPRSVDDGLDEIDPDLVFVHAFSPGLNDWLGDYAEDHPEKILVYRAGVNTLEQWLDLNHRTGSPARVASAIDGLDVFDAIFAPSYAAAERLKLAYGDRTPHLSVAPCTIDYRQYVPTPFMDDGTLRIVTASRMASNNYILAPLLAARRLIDELDIEMRIVGGGQPPFMQTVEGVAAEADDIELTGHLPQNGVREHLEWADVVCVPSLSQQAIPTVAVEAMAAGNVVLCAPFYTTTEEETLIRVPVDHPPAWYDALNDVATSPDEANDLIRQGLEASKEYDTKHVVEEAYLPTFEMLREKNQ